MPWEETEEYIRSGHGTGDYDKDSMRTIDISEEQGIKAISGCPQGKFENGKCTVGTQIQSFLFSKAKGWTAEKAKAWFEKHKESVMKVYLFSESIVLGEGNKVTGEALHPQIIWHPELGTDWKSKHVFLREEVKKASGTGAGKPFGLDHLSLLPGQPTINALTKSWYNEETDGIAFEGIVSDDIARRIGNKEFKGLSIELDWSKPGVMLERVDGVAPRNFDITSVHFLTKFPPGDPEAFVKLSESVIPMEEEIKAEMLRLAEEIDNISKKLYPAEQDLEKRKLRIEMDAKYAEKRGLEDLLASRTIASLTKQVERLNAQVCEDDEKKKKKDEEMMVEIRELIRPKSPPENEVVMQMRRDLTEAQDKLKIAERKVETDNSEAKRKFLELREGIIGSIPPPNIWKAWTSGPKRLIMEQQRILGLGAEPR